jgi:phosphohistidine phosphatase
VVAHLLKTSQQQVKRDVMSTRLYFLRHGVAYERDEWQGSDDELRPLTDKGISAMKQEAKYMKQIKLELDSLITSPLVRARETAKIVADTLDLKLDESSLLKPGFDIAALGKLLKQYDDSKRIMVVGHEPDFSRVISAVIGGGRVEMRKGGLARIDLAQVDPPRGDLVWLLTPSVLGA